MAVAEAPDQKVGVRPGREIRQSRVVFPGSEVLNLVRVVVDRLPGEDRIVTVYRTSRILTGMKVRYDDHTDTLTVTFREVPVVESDEDKPGVILDYDGDGNLVSVEVLDASKRVEEPQTVTTAAES